MTHSIPANNEAASPLLAVKDLQVLFKGAPQPSVKGVSFSIQRNSTLALVGESGSGKSVTALSILRLLNPNTTTWPSGRILFEDQDLLQLPDARLRQIRGRRISMIFQEPMTSLNPLHTIGRQIIEGLQLHRGLVGKAALKRAGELLELVGVDNVSDRLSSFPHQLSGGQKQRAMIAMALANEPDLLIADEPTTALDVTIQKQVLELLAELQRRMGMSILLITHDLAIVRKYADDVVVMRNGEVVEQGSKRQIFDTPRADYTRMLLDSTPSGQAPALDGQAETRLSARNLAVTFTVKKGLFGRGRQDFKALRGINLELKRGETLGIVGESGSGKTTLGLALLRLISSEGTIELDGTRIDTLSQTDFRPYRQRIQVVFQDPYGSLSPRMTIGQIVGEGLTIHSTLSAAEQEKAICAALLDVGLDPDSRHRYPHEFSGGQRQRIAIARALVLHPDIIVLDEPTSALDRSVQCQVIELLRKLQLRYAISYLFISHDLTVIRALSHRVMVLKAGEIVELAETEQLFSNPQHPYTQSLLDAALFYESTQSSPPHTLENAQPN